MAEDGKKTEGLDDEELSTIAAIACNYQSGRITKYEIGELIRGYRERTALLKCEEALREMVDAIKSGSIDSEQLPGDMDSGIAPYKWHQEWDFHARSALTLLDEARK